MKNINLYWKVGKSVRKLENLRFFKDKCLCNLLFDIFEKFFLF